MELVERDGELADLHAALRAVSVAEQGRLALVSGPAGAGKTALVRRFTSMVAAEVAALWGVCDELATPRPMGPFRDIVGQLNPRLAADAGTDPWVTLLDVVIAELGRPPLPRIVVVEDVHWADEATLDALRLLARRISRTSTLLVVTYRDDEVAADHPLRRAVGAVPPDDIQRIELSTLTPEGVARLAGRDDVEDLYRLTGGSPFYVTEVLATPGVAVPPTVQDAVLARVSRLSDDARSCVDLAAVVPGRVETSIMDECGVAEGLDEATDRGVLVADGDLVSFPHELARRAVEGSLAVGRRRSLHRRVLDVLTTRDGDPARLTHHAVYAGAAEAVARFAPLAARRAVSVGSRREAIAHFRQALDHAERYQPAERAALWHDYAGECYLAGRPDAAECALRTAIQLATDLGDRERLGTALCLLSDTTWFLGRGDDAAGTAAAAVEVLTGLPDAEGALARAYAQRAKLAMVDYRYGQAITWGTKAIELARAGGATETVVHALNTTGMAQWLAPPFDNRAVRVSLRLAKARGLTTQASRVYANLAAGHLLQLEYEKADRIIAEGLAFCEEHELSSARIWLLVQRAEANLEQGHWAAAMADVESVLQSGDSVNPPVHAVAGLIQARQGADPAESNCREARRAADRRGDRQEQLKAGLVWLELCWLRGDLASIVPLAEEILDLAERSRSPYYLGEAAVWLHRVGGLAEPPAGAFEPYALHVAGRPDEAAAAWRELGRPYAEADALADSTDPDALLRSLEVLHRLGAAPRAAMVRKRLAKMGVAAVPRGPRKQTRASPGGLTSRQTEVLRLLADGLTYEQIARRLYISVKTVDHHTAAVRHKLGARTRREAVDAGRTLGILPSGQAAERPRT